MKGILIIIIIGQAIIGLGQNITKITGSVHDVGIDTLILAPANKDLRYHGVELPVNDGEIFSYTLDHTFIEEYSLVYKSELKTGAWRPILFFPSSEKIHFELYPSNQYDKNSVSGDNLGIQKLKYQKSFGEKFMKIGNEIYGTFFQLEKGTAEYDQMKIRLDSLNKSALKYQFQYFEKDTSILGLSEYVELLRNAEQMMIPAEMFVEYQIIYLRKEFDHPLIESAINLYTALSSIKIGRAYQNISLTEKSNESKMLSDLIVSNKYTLLDLWAPWCGPCIRKSKVLKDNYEHLNGKLNIIGVVGGIESKQQAIEAVSKYDYPWSTYLEISDKNQIWEKYGISNSGGSQFLIDKSGNIVAINPNLEELKTIMSK